MKTVRNIVDDNKQVKEFMKKLETYFTKVSKYFKETKLKNTSKFSKVMSNIHEFAEEDNFTDFYKACQQYNTADKTDQVEKAEKEILSCIKVLEPIVDDGIKFIK